jgi:hypothetical protein
MQLVIDLQELTIQDRANSMDAAFNGAWGVIWLADGAGGGGL